MNKQTLLQLLDRLEKIVGIRYSLTEVRTDDLVVKLVIHGPHGDRTIQMNEGSIKDEDMAYGRVLEVLFLEGVASLCKREELG